MGKRQCCDSSLRQLAGGGLETRESSRLPRAQKSSNRRVAPVQTRLNGHPAPRRATEGRKRGGKAGKSVADAAFILFRDAATADLLHTAPGYELRLQARGGKVSGGYWHIENDTFVAGWFWALASTGTAWLIAYMPASCQRIEAELVPFSDVERIPTVLRKAGCKVGSATLLVEMMRALVPHYH